MEKINSCLERIRVIRGVSHGLITEEQVRDVFEMYGLSEDQQCQVFEMLGKEGIDPISEAELPTEMYSRKTDREQTCADSKDNRPTDISAYDERRRECFGKLLADYCRDIKNNPGLAERYRGELGALKRAVCQNPDTDASRCVAKAVMTVKVCHARHRVCGTYLSRVICRLATRIRHTVPENELKELVNNCTDDKELTPHQSDILLVLLHNSHMLSARRRHRSY